jgi:hypothetical protein
MKSITTIVAITLFGLLPVAFVHGQRSPKPAAGGAAPAGAGKRSDVYHVHFTKAALGKAVQLGDWLKTPDRSNPMPDLSLFFAIKTACGLRGHYAYGRRHRGTCRDGCASETKVT